MKMAGNLVFLGLEGIPVTKKTTKIFTQNIDNHYVVTDVCSTLLCDLYRRRDAP